MKTKLLSIVFLVVALIFSGMAIKAYAFEHGRKEAGHMDLEDKFFKKAHFILENQEELGLSDEQIKKVKELKIKTKKNIIKTDAEIEMTALDIKALMAEDTIDADAVNKLIDKKYDLKKDKVKSSLAAYLELKGILTKEQTEKIKEIYKKCQKEKK